MRQYYVMFRVDGSMEIRNMKGKLEVVVPRDEVVHGLQLSHGYALYREVDDTCWDYLEDAGVRTDISMKDMFMGSDSLHGILQAINRVYYNDTDGLMQTMVEFMAEYGEHVRLGNIPHV